MPYLHWNPSLVTPQQAQDALRSIIEIAERELPFAARVGQIALSSETAAELEMHLASLYLIALEQGHWVLPDLVDGVLRWLEHVAAEPTLQLPWSA